jgi:hypothetical protein
MYIVTFVEKAEYESAYRGLSEEQKTLNEKREWFGRPHKYWCETQESTFTLWFILTRCKTNDGCQPVHVRVFGDDLVEYDLSRGIPFKPKDKG